MISTTIFLIFSSPLLLPFLSIDGVWYSFFLHPCTCFFFFYLPPTEQHTLDSIMSCGQSVQGMGIADTEEKRGDGGSLGHAIKAFFFRFGLADRHTHGYATRQVLVF